MTLLGLWLLTIATADLLRWEPTRAGRRLPALAGGGVTLAVTAALVGLSVWTYVATLLCGVALLFAWVLTSDRAFAGRGSDRLALLAVAAPVPVALATSGWVPSAAGVLELWSGAPSVRRTSR
jgi:hypothetical protein